MASTTSLGHSTRRCHSRRRVEPPALPDVILHEDPRGGLGEPRHVVAEVEARANRAGKFVDSSGFSRARANELHREADQLYYKGDYESALVLYHRASHLCPREMSHAVAARRAEAAINRAANPSWELARALRDARSTDQMSAVLCPDTAARRARNILANSGDPVDDIPRILRFFDTRKDFWRLSSPSTSPRLARSKLMLRQLSKYVNLTVKDIECAYQTGDAEAVHKLGSELVNLVSLTEEPDQYQIETYIYLVEKQIALARHDKALDFAAKMIFQARTSGDDVAIVKALVTLGKVHLSFGHLDALVRVWERLVEDLRTEAIPQAWLYHDIGRCHLELNEFARAFDSAKLCLEQASKARSRKWLIRGNLLSGQSLLKLGRFGEAVAALKNIAAIAETEEKEAAKEPKDQESEEERSILLYVQGLIEQVTSLLRQLNHERDSRRIELLGRKSEPRNSISKANGATPDTKVDSICENEDEWREPVSERRLCAESSGETSTDEDKIAILLERTRALRRSPSDKSTRNQVAAIEVLSSTVIEDPELLIPDSSRTRIIRRDGDERYDSDDEKIFKFEELAPLSDVSCSEVIGEDDNFASARPEDEENFDAETVTNKTARSEVNSSSLHLKIGQKAADIEKIHEKKSVPYFSLDEELTSRSFSYNLESETEPSDMCLGALDETESIKSLSNSLKGLESRDLEELRNQEHSFFETRSGVENRQQQQQQQSRQQ